MTMMVIVLLALLVGVSLAAKLMYSENGDLKESCSALTINNDYLRKALQISEDNVNVLNSQLKIALSKVSIDDAYSGLAKDAT